MRLLSVGGSSFCHIPLPGILIPEGGIVNGFERGATLFTSYRIRLHLSAPSHPTPALFHPVSDVIVDIPLQILTFPMAVSVRLSNLATRGQSAPRIVGRCYGEVFRNSASGRNPPGIAAGHGCSGANSDVRDEGRLRRHCGHFPRRHDGWLVVWHDGRRNRLDHRYGRHALHHALCSISESV